MPLVNWNSIKIDGNNNLVFQDVDGNTLTLALETFIQQFTREKDARIEDLENTLQDKRKIEALSDYKIAGLQQELAVLREEKQFLETRVRDLLTDFSERDLTTTSQLYQEAFRLFIAGELAAALDVLDEETLLRQEREIQQRREEQAQNRRLKARLLQLEFKFDEAAYNIEKMVASSATCDTHIEAGNFYYNLNEHTKAGSHYEKALVLTQHSEQKAGTLNNLANNYKDQQRFAEAEAAYDAALAIRRELAEGKPSFRASVAVSLNNLGLLYRNQQRFAEAEAAFVEALNIYRELIRDNPNAFGDEVAMLLNNLAILYSDQQRFVEAETSLTAALVIYRELANDNPRVFRPDVAMTLNNRALVYYAQKRFSEADPDFIEALAIRRELAEENPNAFRPDVAMSVNNLAILYRARHRFDEAEAALIEALAIRRELVKENPQAFRPDVAMSLGSLANLYRDQRRFAEAEAAYIESLDIYQELSVNNPVVFSPSVAMTAINMSDFYLQDLLSRAKSLALAQKTIRMAFPYKDVLPMAQQYIGDALNIAEAWGLDQERFFNEALQEQ